MSAQTDTIIRDHGTADGVISIPVLADEVIHFGEIVAHVQGSFLARVPSARTDLIVRGVARNAKDQTGLANAAGDNVQVDHGTWGPFDNSSGVNEITNSHCGLECYAVNGNTLSLTDQGGTLSPAGRIVEVDGDGKVFCNFPEQPYDWALFSDAGATPEDIAAPVRLARGVVVANVADLAAFTVANNGVTYTEGQRVLLAAQTTAAECGLYVVGEVTAGVAALTRAPDAPTGAHFPTGGVVMVGPGNTEYPNSSWKAMATTAGGAIVGTNDPLFYPRQWRGTVTLASGTYTIGVGSTATPDEALFLFSTTDSTVQCTRDTVGGTVTTTIMYVAPVGSRVAGKPGTAAVEVRSAVAAGTILNTDNSTLSVDITNWS